MSHMSEVSVRELRNRTSDVIARIEAGAVSYTHLTLPTTPYV